MEKQKSRVCIFFASTLKKRSCRGKRKVLQMGFHGNAVSLSFSTTWRHNSVNLSVCVRARPARVYVRGLIHQVLTERIICFYFTHLFHNIPLTYYITSHENVFFNVSIHIKYPDVPASWAMSISCCTWCGFVNRLWIQCAILPPGGWTRKHRKKKISTQESNWKYSIITWLCHSINISN